MGKIEKECWSDNDEDYRYDCLSDLLDSNDELSVGDVVYFGDAVKPKLSEFCDADDIIDLIGDRGSDVAGEYADDFPDISEEAKEELDSLINQWMEKHLTVNFFRVFNAQKYILKESDFN